MASEEPKQHGQEGKHSCRNCGSPMEPNQDWCLQCGAGAPESLAGSRIGWGSPAILLLATLALVLGAAAASYAAWGKSAGAGAPVRVSVAQAPTATVPPAPSTPASTTTTTTTTPPVAKLPKTPVKPPKIPLTAVTPKATTKTTTTTTTTTSEQTTTTTTTTGESLPEPILLDTNAASTYNPNGYPAGDFGDPTLAIDGDTGTGWTAEVSSATAPKLEAGLLIDLKAPQKISSLELISATPGMTVQIFGANVSGEETSAPATIADPAWVKISKTVLAKNRHEHIKLLHPQQAYRFILLWIRAVPASAVGTPEAPGQVSVNELELFPSE